MSVWKVVEELDAGTRDLLVTAVSAAALLALLAVLAVWIYNYATLGVCTNHVRMDNKTVIITGSNSGQFTLYFCMCVFSLRETLINKQNHRI